MFCIQDIYFCKQFAEPTPTQTEKKRWMKKVIHRSTTCGCNSSMPRREVFILEELGYLSNGLPQQTALRPQPPNTSCEGGTDELYNSLMASRYAGCWINDKHRARGELKSTFFPALIYVLIQWCWTKKWYWIASIWGCLPHHAAHRCDKGAGITLWKPLSEWQLNFGTVSMQASII